MLLFYFLILLLPLSSHQLWTRPIAGGITAIKLLGAIIILYALSYLAIRKSHAHFLGTWQARLFVLLTILAMLSVGTRSHSALLVNNAFLSYISFVLLYFTAIVLVDSLRHLQLVILSMIGSMGLASLYVVREWYKYHNMFHGFRAGWISGDGNYFAASALVTLPLAYYFSRVFPRRLEGVFCLSCYGLTLVALMLTASRGGFVGLLVGLLFITWRSRARLRNLILIGLTVGPILLLVPLSPLQRLLHPNYSDEIGSQSRLVLWKAGLHMIADHPLFGVGLGNFKPMSRLYIDPKAVTWMSGEWQGIAHNVYLEMFAELGIIGLGLFVAMLVCTYRSLEGVRRRTSGTGANLLNLGAEAMQVSLVSFSVSLFFLSGQYQKLFWLMLFVSMCLPALEIEWQKNRQRAATAARIRNKQPRDSRRPPTRSVSIPALGTRQPV